MASSRFQQLSHRYWDSWLPELVALVFSTLCLLGLVILLSQCDQKPTFDWHGVTVNALVAVLSTLSRASLMAALANTIGQTKWSQFMNGPRSLYWLEVIDGASRDAWGRLTLLCRSPLGIASLGAFAALLTLAFDPFTQQLVSTESRLIYTNGTVAEIPRCARYSRGLFSTNSSTMMPAPRFCDGSPESEEWGSVTKADFSMQAAILNGFRDGSTAEQLGVNSRQCATGNCTWPGYRSLSVCNECFDLANRVTRTRAPGSQLVGIGSSAGGVSTFTNNTALLLPNNLYLSNADSLTWNGDLIEAQSQYPGAPYRVNPQPFMIMTTYGTSSPNQTNAFAHATTLIWAESFLRVRAPQTAGEAQTKPWPDAEVEALECGLYWCVKEYESNVVNGIPVEKVTQPRHEDVQRDEDSWQMIPPNQTVVPGPIVRPPPPITILSPDQVQNLSGLGCLSKLQRTDLRLEGAFNISRDAVWGTTSFLASMLTFGADMHETTARGNRSNSTDTWAPTFNGFYGLPDLAQWAPDVMDTMVRTEDIPGKFSILAESMTNSMRSYADNDTQATGGTGYVHIVVVVRWAWIAFPVAVWALALGQFIITLVVTKHSGAPLWKSSALALLSRGEHCARLLNQQGTISQIEHAAKQHRVELFEDGVPEKGGLVVRTRSRVENEDRGVYNRKKPTTRGRWT